MTIKRADFKEKINFFSIRFLANVLEDFSGKKTKEDLRRKILQRFLIQLGIRS